MKIEKVKLFCQLVWQKEMSVLINLANCSIGDILTVLTGVVFLLCTPFWLIVPILVIAEVATTIIGVDVYLYRVNWDLFQTKEQFAVLRFILLDNYNDWYNVAYYAITADHIERILTLANGDLSDDALENACMQVLDYTDIINHY